MSPTRSRHWRIAGEVCTFLALYRRKTGKGRLGVAEPGLYVDRNPDTVRVPDVLCTFYEEAGEGFEEVAPALCVKVMSESNTWLEMGRRTKQYLDFGVQLVWIIAPKDRAVHAFRLDGTTDVFGNGDTLTGETALPGLEIPVAELFK